MRDMLRASVVVRSRLPTMLGSYALLLIVLFMIGKAKIGILEWHWDDGNVLYDTWRVMLGQVPNVDFVSGYPGGYFFISATFMRFLGINVLAAHTHALVNLLLLATIVYVLCLLFTGVRVAMLIAFLSASWSMLAWWVATPGDTAQMGLLLAVLASLRWMRTDAREWRWVLMVGLLLGATFTVKQTAVIGGMGFLYLAWWVFGIKQPHASPSWLRSALIGLAFGGHVVFLAVRFHAGHAPLNYLVLLPWVLLDGYLLWHTWRIVRQDRQQVQATGSEPVLLKALAAGIAGGLIAVMPLVLWYVSRGANLLSVLNEVFLRVPPLVDRDAPQPDFFGGYDLLVLLLGSAILLLHWQGSGQVRTHAVTIASAIAVFIAGLAALTPLYSVWSLPRQGLLVRLVDFAWPFLSNSSYHPYALTLVATILALVVVEVGRRSAEQRTRRHAEDLLVLLLYAAPWFAVMYPFPTNNFTAAVSLLLLAGAYALALRLLREHSQPGLSRSRQVRRAERARRAKEVQRDQQRTHPSAADTSRLFLIFDRARTALPTVATIAVLLSAAILLLPPPVFGESDYERIESPRWEGWVNQHRLQPFVALADKLRTLPADARIATYPNASLSLFLAERLTPSFYGNYFGDLDADLRALASEIQAKDITVVITNRDVFPYGKEHPYFAPPEDLVALLGPDFELTEQISHFDIYVRKR